MLTDNNLFERVDRHGRVILDIPALYDLTSPPIQIIHRSLGGADCVKPEGQAFYLISFNGCFHRLIATNSLECPIEATTVGFKSVIFNESLLNEEDTNKIIETIKNYLIENLIDVVGVGEVNYKVNTVEHLATKAQWLMQFMVSRLAVGSSNHRAGFIDMSNR